MTYTVSSGTLNPTQLNPFSLHYSFYKCSMIFGTHYTELICNTTIIDLPTSPTYYYVSSGTLNPTHSLTHLIVL